jgi:hypothetical protein
VTVYIRPFCGTVAFSVSVVVGIAVVPVSIYFLFGISWAFVCDLTPSSPTGLLVLSLVLLWNLSTGDPVLPKQSGPEQFVTDPSLLLFPIFE